MTNLEEKIQDISNSIMSGKVNEIQYLSPLPDDSTTLTRKQCCDLVVRSVFMKNIIEKIEQRRHEDEISRRFCNDCKSVISVICFTIVIYVSVKAWFK